MSEHSAEIDAIEHDEWCPVNGCRCGKCGPCLGPPLCVIPPAEIDARVAAFNAAYCRPYGPLTERDDAYWDAPTPPEVKEDQ